MKNCTVGETAEAHRIVSESFSGILNISPHFGWHRVNSGYIISRATGLSDEYLVFITADGTGDVTIAGKRYAAVKNTVCLLPPRVSHSYTTGSDWEFYWMHLTSGSCPVFFEYLIKEKGHFFSVSSINPLKDRIESMLESHEFGIEAEIKDSAAISGLLHDMIEMSVQDSRIKLDNNDIIKEILTYIEGHYMEKITVSELSKLIYMSEGHTIRLFKYYTGYTPYAYLKSYRIMQATRLLDTTAYSIGQIAEKTGYHSVSHFISDFKSLKSIPPHEYRMKYRHT